MLNFIIRKSAIEDMPQVLKLIQELAIFERAEEEAILSVEDLERDGFGEQPLFSCIVAENETEGIIGTAIFYNRFSTWKGKTVHLEDLIVREKFRSQGVGSALYRAVMQEAYNQGVKRVEWAVLDWNEGAIKFYEQSGAQVLRDWDTAQMDESSLKKFLGK